MRFPSLITDLTSYRPIDFGKGKICKLKDEKEKVEMY
jgi:hypothetical protein